MATFAVWVWTTKGASTSVAVTAQVAGWDVGAPTFSVCPVSTGSTCSVGDMQVGQADKLEVTVPVQAGAIAGKPVELTAQASAADAVGYSSTAIEVVSTVPVTQSPSPVLAPPPTLPAIAGTSGSAADPANLFPTVQPSPSAGSLGPAGSGSGLPVDTATAAAPFNGLLDAQLGGIAVLGAVIIGCATLLVRSTRSSRAQRDGHGQQERTSQLP